MSDEREFLTLEQAVAMLPDGERIHTFRQAGGCLLGADWGRADVLIALQNHRPELSGEQATRMQHGIWIDDNGRGGLFIATRKAD